MFRGRTAGGENSPCAEAKIVQTRGILRIWTVETLSNLGLGLAEFSEQIVPLDGAQPCCGIPSAGRLIEAICASDNVIAHARRAVKYWVQEATAACCLFIEQSHQSGVQRGTRAGATDDRTHSIHQNLIAGLRFGIASHVRNAPSVKV